jgi:hypothetical protein
VSPRVGLLQACEDPNLFGPAFEPDGLWPRQRDLLADVEEGPRLHVWALGRRSSKTTSCALVGLWCCLLRPELLAALRPGERGYAVGVATSLRQARLLVQAARSVVERSPVLRSQVEASTEDELLFVNGTGFTAFPCSSRGGRGWPIFCLVMDEAAHFLSETEGPQAADRVFEALVPSTAQFGNDARVLVASTPWGSGNLFADLHRRASAGELEDALAQHATTAEMNPTIDPVFLAQEQARDPEGFRQEYEANFLTGGEAFLDPAMVELATLDRPELDPALAEGWVAGLDPAFSSDPFGLAIVGRDRNDHRRLLLGLARRWTPRRRKASSLEEGRAIEDVVLEEVAAVCKRYGARCVTDQYKSRGVTELLRRRGLAVKAEPMTATSKSEAFAELRARLNAGTLELYAQPDLLAELRRLRTRYTAGRAMVDNPRVGGSHGDIAQALALATWALRREPARPSSVDYDDAYENPLARRRERARLRFDGQNVRFPRPGDPL